MATKYKVWVEIERIDVDDEGNETFTDEDCPISVGEFESLEAAVEIQILIETVLKYKVMAKSLRQQYITAIMGTKYKSDDPKYDDQNLLFLESLSLIELQHLASDIDDDIDLDDDL